MRRTSFAGALVVVAIGAVLAFAIHSSPKDFDLQIGGLLLMLGGAADLVIRSLIADSPLLSRQSAEVAAVVEPLGDPVLDAAGHPIAVTNPAAGGRPPLIAPLPGTMPPETAPDTIVVTDDPYSVVRIPAAGRAQAPSPAPAVGDPDYGAYESAVRAESGNPLDTPESPVKVTTLGGRPVRPRGRGFGRARRRQGRSW
jgi:hypothetical protein